MFWPGARCWKRHDACPVRVPPGGRWRVEARIAAPVRPRFASVVALRLLIYAAQEPLSSAVFCGASARGGTVRKATRRRPGDRSITGRGHRRRRCVGRPDVAVGNPSRWMMARTRKRAPRVSRGPCAGSPAWQAAQLPCRVRPILDSFDLDGKCFQLDTGRAPEFGTTVSGTEDRVRVRHHRCDPERLPGRRPVRFLAADRRRWSRRRRRRERRSRGAKAPSKHGPRRDLGQQRVRSMVECGREPHEPCRPVRASSPSIGDSRVPREPPDADR